MPEGHATGDARCRRDEDAVEGDLLDPPARRAEEEDVALLHLEHHLLVELSDAALALLGSGEEDAVQTAIGDRPAARDGDDLRALARAHEAARAVPHDARPQLGELVRRIAPREHVQDALEGAARKLRERGGLVNDALEIFDGPVIHRGHRDDLLRDDVGRIARIAERLDRAVLHALGDRSRRQEVAAVLRDDDPGRRLVDAVTGPSDALHATRDRRRRLDLDDEVDRAHVDAELERARRDKRGQPS